MNFRDFLPLANTLLTGATEAHWRSATSRAYYAAFHVGRQFLGDLGFTIPRADRAHAYIWLRLSNCGHPDVGNAGQNLNQLRQERNRADYDAVRVARQATATRYVQTALEIIHALDMAGAEPTRTLVTEAMKVYERDVLKDVTWKP